MIYTFLIAFIFMQNLIGANTFEGYVLYEIEMINPQLARGMIERRI